MNNDYHDRALANIEGILERLKIDYDPSPHNHIDIICPIHGSDDMGNSIIYKDSGVWLCFSGNCHCDWGSGVLGLIRGTLKEDNWSKVKEFIDSNDSGKIIVRAAQKEFSLEDMFKNLKELPPMVKPSKYYLKRGYKEDTLLRYGVGDCSSGPYSGKAIIPVHYIDGRYMGYSARSHFDSCPKCSFHHSAYTTCIPKSSKMKFLYGKFYHSKGLHKSRTLYGIDKIGTTNKVAIVEGPGCVWKLDQFGIPAVACLGKDFSKLRLALLKRAGINKVLFMSDNDGAGKEFRTRFIKDYCNDLEIYFPQLTSKDVGEMSDEDIKNCVLRKWETL